MMNLIAVSYKNIWPFKDKTISIFFDNWKYLIKSPIWTWKSFLFFDWPMYALYKYSSRNLLNVSSKEWFIKLLWDLNWEKYLVVRKIKKWKAKDSCQSELFKIEWLEKIERKNQDILMDTEIDIQDWLKNNSNINIDEIKFKNETDFQLHLNSFLEPREVFLSTVFLMQDNENIFEMLPTERLKVLKNVFWLLGIDEAKEKVIEKKRELVSQIRANEDSSKYDSRLKSLIKTYLSYFEDLRKLDIENMNNYSDFWYDMNLVKDKINANEFDINNFPFELNAIIDEKIETKKNEYNKIWNQKENMLKDKTDIMSLTENLEKEKSSIIKLISRLEENIKKVDQNKLNDLKLGKNEILQDMEKIENEINSWYTENKLWIKKDSNIWDYYSLVQELVNKWKLYKAKKDWLIMEIKNWEILKEKEIDKLKTEINNLKEKEDQNIQEKNKLEKNIEIFEKNMQEQEIFDCEKISWKCPFVKLINKNTFDNLEKEKQRLYKEKKLLEQNIQEQNIEKKIKEIKEKILEIEKDNEYRDQKNSEIKKIELEIENIREFLERIDYKKIWWVYENYKDLDRNLKNIDKQLSILIIETEKLQEYKIEIEKNKIRIQNIEEKLMEIKLKIQNLDNDIKEIEKGIDKINFDDIKKIDKINIWMKENIRDMKNLLEDFKKSQIYIKDLKEKEKMLNNLYLIFSKELLLIVLQDSIPILNDIINSFLSQVVDYQINFDLNKTDNEKLELEIKIIDDKWIRDVKSLSGWQRVILKLVWMLAISSYIRSPILFLDETINNLDSDTVWRVANMLEDFVKSRNMKFFVVTHSQQIQDMKIWDKVLEFK